MDPIEVRPEDALVKFEYEFPVPPPILWEYITKPEYRAILFGSDHQEIHNRSQGRTAVDLRSTIAHTARVHPCTAYWTGVLLNNIQRMIRFLPQV